METRPSNKPLQDIAQNNKVGNNYADFFHCSSFSLACLKSRAVESIEAPVYLLWRVPRILNLNCGTSEIVLQGFKRTIFFRACKEYLLLISIYSRIDLIRSAEPTSRYQEL